MTQDQITDMYANDDDDALQSSPENHRVAVGQKGMLTEVEINGKKLTIIDPAAVRELDRMMRSMRTKMSLMEQDLRTLRTRLAATEANLRDARDELDNKVSYSRD